MKAKNLSGTGVLLMIAIVLNSILGYSVACEGGGEVAPALEDVPESEELSWTYIGSIPRLGSLFRYVDISAGVVCWIYGSVATDGAGGDIYCLPLSETELNVK